VLWPGTEDSCTCWRRMECPTASRQWSKIISCQSTSDAVSNTLFFSGKGDLAAVTVWLPVWLWFELYMDSV
jgi:hypothetical protein